MKTFYLSVKNEIEQDKISRRGSARSVAYNIVKTLLEENEDVSLQFIITQKNKELMSEKVVAVLRIANQFLKKPNKQFKDLLEGKEDYVLKTSLPMVKTIKSDKIDINTGYEKRVKVHEIKISLEEKPEIKETSEVRLSVSEDSKNAGAVASRVLRTLLVDEKDCALTFVLSPQNSSLMCEKLISMQRIMNRMLRDPGNIIHSSLPVKVKYEVYAYAPEIKKVKNSDININVHEVIFKVK